MKILFIRNSCNLMSHSQMGYGIGIVATIAHDAGHEVKVIDNNTLYKFYKDKEFVKIIKKFNPDILAYGVTLHNSYTTYNQIKKFKKMFPSKIIIAGGIHMKQCFKEALDNGADIVVNREGEKVIIPLLEYLGKNKKDYKKNLSKIKGISFIREDKSYYFAKEFPTIKSLDEVPFVNYELFNIKDFIKNKVPEPGIFYINGMRGCPFGCKFCSDEIQRRDKRMSSAKWLFENVQYLYKNYKVRYLLIADNNITLSRDRLVEFCNRMIESGLNEKMSFSCQTTTRFSIDEELIVLMKKAGFHRINFGLERLTPYSLKKVSKEQPLENVHNILHLISKHNIDPSIFMMVGFPFETPELLSQEKKLFLELTKYTHRLFLSVLCPTPGTIYYDGRPNLKGWYLNKKESLMLRAYFTNVLDMHTFHTIDKNFFNLPRKTRDSILDYYWTFKKINQGSVFTKKNMILDFVMKMDLLLAKISQAIFNISPSLEFFMFEKLKSIRYYLGNKFLSKNIIGEN